MLSQVIRVREFLLAKAQLCIHTPAGQLKYKYVTPTFGIQPGSDDGSEVSERSLTGHYLQMYDWDACFFSQAANQFGDKSLAYEVVSNFLSLMRDDGYIPRTISPQRIWDGGDHCKPFLAQTLLRMSRSHCKTVIPLNYVDKLQVYLNYFRNNRRHSSGLHFWRNVLESGVDNNLALLAACEASKDENLYPGFFPDGKLLAVDINTYLAAEFAAFSELARETGKEPESLTFAQHAINLQTNIEDLLWDETMSMYCNLNPDHGEKIKIRSWTGLLPVFLGLAKPERAEQVIQKNIMSEEHFLTPAGICSTARSEALFNLAQRGLYGRIIVSNWQGPVWVLINVLAVRGLLYYGFNAQAKIIAERMIATLAHDLESSGTLHENYHTESGVGLWAPDFMSWNLLALELIDLIA